MKTHWNNVNIEYNRSWSTLAQKEMSRREMDFINYYLKKKKPKIVLDIGVGTGRVLRNLIKNTGDDTQIFAIDYAKKMVSYCQKTFKTNKKVKKIAVCDVSRDNIDIFNSFDFVTAIRILQYNKNWVEILKKIYKKINKKGILIFSMPNYNSINRFIGNRSGHTTVLGLKKILPPIGFEIIEVRSMTKIPDFFYQCSFADNVLYTKILIFLEKTLEIIFGKTFLGRVLFIVVRKKN